MKKIIISFLILFVVILLIALSGNIFVKNPLFLKSSAKITINKQVFNLLIAETAKEKQVGLSQKKSLPNDYGMLFPFEKQGYYSFWMKDMKFPIDIIFIKDKKIVTIYDNIKPPSSKSESLTVYQSTEVADTILEINAGLSKKHGFKKGMEIKYENFGS